MNSYKDNLERLALAVNPALGIEPDSPDVKRLQDYFSQALGLPVEIVRRESYEETLNGLEQGEIEAAQLGPYAFALAQARFGAVALVNTVEVVSATGDDEKDVLAPYRSVIFTRADSGITNLAQLKNQPFGFVDRNSTTGYLVASFLLQQAGLDPARDLQPVFLGSHRAVAEAVLRGEVLAGAIMENEFARQSRLDDPPRLRLLAASPLISKGPVVVRPGLPAVLERKLLGALLRLDQEEPQAARLLLPPGQRFAPATQRELTLKNIADLAGVSYGTVSRAINGRDRIAPATTARIKKLVEELGYRPNANARSLHKTRGDLVGLGLPSLDYSGLDEILAGLQRGLDEAQLQLVVYRLGNPGRLERQKSYFELLYDGRLEGTLLTQWSLLDESATGLIRSGRPVALLEQDLLESGLQWLWQELQGRGYRWLGLVSSSAALLEPKITAHTLKRLAGEAFRFTLVADQPADLDQLADLLPPERAATALFCPDEELALTLQRKLAPHSARPLVVGWGDNPRLREAGLTRLDFNRQAVGLAAARRLLVMLGEPLGAGNPDLGFKLLEAGD